MASLIYTQSYADGSSKLVRRSVRQGRKPGPPELRRNRRVIGSVTQQMRDRLDAVIGGPLTESNILEHALLLWFENYADNCTVICSKQ